MATHLISAPCRASLKMPVATASARGGCFRPSSKEPGAGRIVSMHVLRRTATPSSLHAETSRLFFVPLPETCVTGPGLLYNRNPAGDSNDSIPARFDHLFYPAPRDARPDVHASANIHKTCGPHSQPQANSRLQIELSPFRPPRRLRPRLQRPIPPTRLQSQPHRWRFLGSTRTVFAGYS